MKKLALATLAIGCAAAYAQGTITFNNRVLGVVITHVFEPLSANPAAHQIGNGSADFLPGTTDWTGYTPLSGSNFFAQLLAARGLDQPESSLLPIDPVVTFRSGLADGFVAGRTATVPNAPSGTPATVEMVAWDNTSGLYPTWTEAKAAWLAGLIAAGKSGTLNIAALDGTGTPPNLIGLQSFNIYDIPEPGTIAFFGLSAAALLISCRQKLRFYRKLFINLTKW